MGVPIGSIVHQLAGTDDPGYEIPPPEQQAEKPHGVGHMLKSFLGTISGSKLGEKVRQNIIARQYVIPAAQVIAEKGDASGYPPWMQEIIIDKAASLADPDMAKLIKETRAHTQEQQRLAQIRDQAKRDTQQFPSGSASPLPPPPATTGPAAPGLIGMQQTPAGLAPPPGLSPPAPPAALTPPPETPGLPGVGFGNTVGAMMGPLDRNQAGMLTPVGQGQVAFQQTFPAQQAGHEVELARAAQQRQMVENYLAKQDWFTKLSPRQQAEVKLAMIGVKTNITPELKPQSIPGLVQGSAIPPEERDIAGQPIEPNAQYRVRQLADGTREYWKELGVTNNRVVPDEKSPTGFSLVTLDRGGNEIHRTLGATPPPAFVPESSSTSTSTQVPVQIGDKVVMMPKTTTTGTQRTRNVPGSNAPPALSPPPATRSTAPGPPASTPESPSLPRGAKVLGETPAAFKMRVENQYTPAGQHVLQETDPVLRSIDRGMGMLEKLKSSNQPFEMALKRAGYSLGLATEVSSLINNLELNRIVGAARVLKGSSRAVQALEKAMVHLPNPKVDSPKLMYEKFQNVRQNLKDIMDSVDRYEKKYPGMTAPPATNETRRPLTDIFK